MYGSGYVHNVRRVAVWIDSETLMIRKIFQDTPKGMGGGGTRFRFTYTFEPQVNPALDDSRFKFAVPTRQR
jgi:outer membrane lipoprotein-sorting protein